MKKEMKALLNTLLSEAPSETKITIVFPGARQISDIEKSRINYRNLLKSLEKELLQRFPRRVWEYTLKKLRQYEPDNAFYQVPGKGIVVFANNGQCFITHVNHEVSDYVYVGDEFLLKELFVVDEIVERPQYLIEISTDRLFCLSLHDLEETTIEGIHPTLPDYFGDFDVNSNLNVGSYGGLVGTHHGHHTKDVEQEREQVIYYSYLNEKMTEYYKNSNMRVIISGVQAVVTKFLRVAKNTDYIFEVLQTPISGLSKKTLEETIEKIFSEKKAVLFEEIAEEIEQSKRNNKCVNALQDIQLLLAEGQVRKLIVAERSDGYSIENNRLMKSALENGVVSVVLSNVMLQQPLCALLK